MSELLYGNLSRGLFAQLEKSSKIFAKNRIFVPEDPKLKNFASEITN